MSDVNSVYYGLKSSISMEVDDLCSSGRSSHFLSRFARRSAYLKVSPMKMLKRKQQQSKVMEGFRFIDGILMREAAESWMGRIRREIYQPQLLKVSLLAEI